ELGTTRSGVRTHRHLVVTKFRGSAYSEGLHSYLLTADGVVVHPRLEGRLAVGAGATPGEPGKLPSGVPGLDEALMGGLARGASTLVLGPPGSGKTTLGMQFLAAGIAAGQPALHCGFFETPAQLLLKADRLSIPLRPAAHTGRMNILWTRPAEV